MLKNIMKQFPNTKSIYQRLLWLVSVLLFVSTLVVSSLIVMILYLVFLVVIWPLVIILLNVLELVLMLAGSEVSILVSEAVKSNIRESYHSLKNLKVRLSAVLKTALGAVVQLFISQFGTKK